MSYHLNPASALTDHRGSIAWLNTRPHSAAYCYELGPDRVKAECLYPQKAVTIFQHTHATANRLAMATNHSGCEDPCDGCIHAEWFPPFLSG